MKSFDLDYFKTENLSPKMKYYIDNYTFGSPRDIRGPFTSLEEARKRVDGVKVRVSPYDGVIEDMSKHGENATLVEAWARSEDSEDYQAIYSVE